MAYEDGTRWRGSSDAVTSGRGLTRSSITSVAHLKLQIRDQPATLLYLRYTHESYLQNTMPPKEPMPVVADDENDQYATKNEGKG